MAAAKSKKQRKFGRNKLRCGIYANERRAEKSKVRRLRKHLRNHRTDSSAVEAIKTYAKMLGMKAETFHDLQGVFQ